LSILNDSVKSDLVTTLQRSPCYGIICDETTDLSTTKQLIIYIKAIVDCDVDTFFLALKELNDASAKSIVKSILTTLSEHGLDLSNCTGLGSDGASVITGKHSGVYLLN
jgi:hypothetical protein